MATILDAERAPAAAVAPAERVWLDARPVYAASAHGAMSLASAAWSAVVMLAEQARRRPWLLLLAGTACGLVFAAGRWVTGL